MSASGPSGPLVLTKKRPVDIKIVAILHSKFCLYGPEKNANLTNIFSKLIAKDRCLINADILVCQWHLLLG